MYLYIGCNGVVAAIDPADGRMVWVTSLATGGFFPSTESQDVCLLEHQGTVFAGCYGHLFALAGDTGEILWHNKLEGLGYNDVTLAIAGKSIQYISTHTRS
jgi:outer membrane protein assembly factor BamB